MRQDPKPGEIWQHVRRGKHRVVTIARSCCDYEFDIIAYTSLEDGVTRWRPLEEFMGESEQQAGMPRFRKVEE